MQELGEAFAMSGIRSIPAARTSRSRERPFALRYPRALANCCRDLDRTTGFNHLSHPIYLSHLASRFTSPVQNLQRHRHRIQSPQKGNHCIMSLPDDAASSLAQAFLVNTPLFFAARQSKQSMLTRAGLRHAYGLGMLLWTTLSWRGYSLCFLFLILGSAVTLVGKEKKEALGIAEKRGGARGPENLWGAAGVAAVLAVLTFLARGFRAVKIERWLTVGYAGALAAKFSDTAGSEIGKAFGTKTYSFGTWKQVKAGSEGGVSVEGSVASVAGSLLAAGVAWWVGLVSDGIEFLVVGFSGAVASTLESAVGRKFQEELGLSNEAVNVVNTFVGAVVGMFLQGVRLWMA